MTETWASISQMVYDAGQKLAASNDSLTGGLNHTLNQLLKLPYRATQGFVRDAEGQRTDIFGTVIYTSSQPQSIPASSELDANNVACVIDIEQSLDVENLRAAYERIVCAKRLKKTRSPYVPGVFLSTTTLGIIFARDSTVPLETLAEELKCLNSKHSDREWIDMLAVLSKGVINYAIQFPGENSLGVFMPPPEGPICHYPPPIYVIMSLSATGLFTFNKMCSFLMAHLMVFSPGADLPKFNLILLGTPEEALLLTKYQYNLSGNFMPMTSQVDNAKFALSRPFLIEDTHGNLKSTLRYLPWQDGGVVLLKGKFPLMDILPFIKEKLPEPPLIINRDDGQISHVLPITQTDFFFMLQRLQNQSNLTVKLDQSPLVCQKIMDEGLNSPFIARLYFGIFCMRDAAFLEINKHDAFDKPYEQAFEALLNTRSASQKITKLISDHFVSLTNRRDAQIIGHTIHIEKPIDKELRKEVETFLNNAVRTLKYGMQELAKALGEDIGFLFKKQSTFEDKIKLLEIDDQCFATYLVETRKWTEQLIKCRNDVEHNGWSLPKITYTDVSGSIQADEPEISGQKVSDFVKFILDRLSCFVEEVTIHCLVERMPIGISVTETPLHQRELNAPLRFQITLTHGGMPTWHIRYHQTLFEET